ncbi:uncharacterized protein [Triticum aestivum]|uniref:uncharacterized protein isoform X3 n=1 Tax=Triticum aestivum TaxID=4565 RepID=UPI001D00C0DC|nr:uncharacterized protein LOC123043687 isoform X3 [Triticum aestivum]
MAPPPSPREDDSTWVMKVARATARRTSMPWASREQDPRSALSPSSSRRPWHKLYSRPTITDAAADGVPVPTRWGTAARPGRSGPAPSSAHPPASSRLHLGRDWSRRQSRGRRARHGRWRRRGRGGRHERAQVSGCSSPYTGRAPFDLCQESNQNYGSLFTLGLLSAGKRTQSMLDAIGHIDPTVPVYHWKINRCDALLREVMGENLYKEVIVAAPKEDEGDFGCIVIRGNDVLHGVANFMFG